jgi:hypothetical protein
VVDPGPIGAERIRVGCVKSTGQEVAAELDVSPEVRVGPGTGNENEEQPEDYRAGQDEGRRFQDGR